METIPALPLRLAELVIRVQAAQPMHRGFLERALAQLDADECARLEAYLAFAARRGLDAESLAECYLTVVTDTLREQIFFARNDRYRHSRYDEVAAAVYDDPDYMNRYMYGLALTAFLWPNHREMARFFRRVLPRGRGGAYLEIGPGHGYYLMEALAQGAWDTLRAVDISATSIEQTRAVLEHFCPDDLVRCRLEQRDFFDAGDLPPASQDAIVMGEVLEHVERPEAFLRRIAELARPDAFIFVTTCVNAPAIDHIYLWRDPAEVEALIEACGLHIETALRLPYEGKSLDECRRDRLAVNVAYVLRKAPADTPG